MEWQETNLTRPQAAAGAGGGEVAGAANDSADNARNKAT